MTDKKDKARFERKALEIQYNNKENLTDWFKKTFETKGQRSARENYIYNGLKKIRRDNNKDEEIF